MLGSLRRAATVCRERGERLVLVVDGLDEDEGLTAGPGVYSIASMLRPPAGWHAGDRPADQTLPYP